VACLALSGCSLFEGEGQVTLSVADAPVDGLDSVVVQFNRVTFVTDDDERESITFSPPQRVDLLEFTDGEHFALLADEPLPDGRYRKIEFRLDASADTTDSYVTEAGSDLQLSLDVPDEFEPQLTVSTDFTVDQDSSVDVTVDVDLRRSLFQDDDGTYELRPKLRAVLDDEVGSVGGTVSSGLLDNCSGPAVYAFSGSSVTPDDVDQAGVEPVNSAIVDTADGSYAIGFLEAGSYTLAFTCDADLDEPDASDDDVDFTRELNVTITADRASTQNIN
jgi:hypothetical protein